MLILIGVAVTMAYWIDNELNVGLANQRQIIEILNKQVELQQRQIDLTYSNVDTPDQP